MYNPYPNDPNYTQAYWLVARRVRARTTFYWHLAIFLTINAFLFLIYLVNSLTIGWFGYPWFLWPLGVWGFFLVLRFLRVFVFPDSPAHHQEMIARELARMPYLIPPVYPAQPPATSNNHHPGPSQDVVPAGKERL